LAARAELRFRCVRMASSRWRSHVACSALSCSAVAVADRTHVILDGLEDPGRAQELSRAWVLAGFPNAVDLSGQCAWLAKKHERRSGSQEGDMGPLSELQMGQAVSIARVFAVELRDRAGGTYIAENELGALRRRVQCEYRHRVAVVIMFGLPAVALHYLAPYLAGSGDPRDMALPWLFELLLVGWACIAAGWPILWQGALSVLYLRASADLLTSVVLVTSYLPSAVGVLAVTFVEEPMFDTTLGRTPMCYATILALGLAVTQRWMMHRATPRLSGFATLMLRGFSRLVAIWLILMIFVGFAMGWRWALSIGMLLPPCLSLGSVNRWSPGWSMALPVFAFTVLLLIAPSALRLSVEGVEVEIATCFGMIMTMVFALGWAKFVRTFSPNGR